MVGYYKTHFLFRIQLVKKSQTQAHFFVAKMKNVYVLFMWPTGFVGFHFIVGARHIYIHKHIIAVLSFSSLHCILYGLHNICARWFTFNVRPPNKKKINRHTKSLFLVQNTIN